MPDYVYKLSNGKSLTLSGDTPPSDEEVEGIATEQGVSLLAAETIPEVPIQSPIQPPIVSSEGPSPEILAKRKSLGYGRQDEQTFDLDKFTSGMNNVTNRISDFVGRQDWIPEIAKGTLATAGAIIPEALNFGAAILSDPTSAATSVGVGRALSSRAAKAVVPEVIPPITNLPDGLSSQWPAGEMSAYPRVARERGIQIPELSESTLAEVNQPRFISGEAGTAINKPHLYDMGPNSPDLSESHFGSLNERPIGGTVLPQEYGELAQVDPALMASGMLPSRPVNQINKMLEGLGIQNPEGVAAQMGLANTPPEGFYGPGTTRLGRENLPSARSAIVKPRVESTIPVADPVVAAQQESAIITKVKADTVNTLVLNGAAPNVAAASADAIIKVPELAPVISDPGFIKKYMTAFNNRETPGSRLTAGLTSSMDSEFDNQLPRLGELTKQTQVDSHIKAGTWISKYDNFTEPLSDKQFSNLIEVIEGKAQPLDDKVMDAAGQYKLLDNEISQEATSTGMGLKSNDGSKMIPWVGRDKYFPHMYTEDFFESLKNNPKDIRAQLIQAGKSPAEIDALLSNSKKYGERLIDAQHSREADLPGYRTDRNVYRQHIADMAKRITEAKNYGPMDIAAADSPISELLKQTKNPEYSTQLMSKLLGRNEGGNRDSLHIARKLVSAQAWLHLSTAGISNMSSALMTPIQTNIKSFVQGIGESIFQAKQTGEFAKEAGAMQNIFKEIFAASVDESDKFMPTKFYGLDAGERFMRKTSADAGSIYVKQLFNEVKAGNTSPLHLKRLQELTLTSPQDLVLQTDLNPQQLKRAAFRTAELSQGLAEMQNLPEHWTGSGIANILTLFHKYQFAQTKIVKDMLTTGSVKQNLRNLAMLTAASQVAGEIVGDAKATIRGTVRAAYSGDTSKIEEEIMNRGSFAEKQFGLEESPVMARFIENAMQSFALGMYADIIEAMHGTGENTVMRIAGSTIGDLAKIWNIGRDIAGGNVQGAVSKTTSFAPLVGPPIAAEMREAPIEY